jgi:ABC-type multidrug transport system fused ATPase/permease subunit
MVGLPVAIVKFLDGFGAFLYAPFILLLPPYSTNAKSNSTNKRVLIYYIVMVILALITNSRMGMIGPILFVAMSYLMVFLTGRIEIDNKIFTKFFIIGIIGFFALGVMSDISTAILIERAYRNDRNMSDQISATFNTYTNKEKLRTARINLLRKNKTLSSHDWKEDYINNDFIARFVQIKFDDNCLSRIYSFTPTAKKKLADVTFDKILVTLPTPIINILGLNIDKLYVSSFSMGDMIDFLAGHGYLGGFKTGSIIANSYCIFGWWYPFILLLLYFLIIRIFQFLIYRTSNLTKHNNISTLSLIVPFYLFTSISLDSLSSVVATLLRGIWQIILMYYIALFILSKMNKIIK